MPIIMGSAMASVMNLASVDSVLDTTFQPSRNSRGTRTRGPAGLAEEKLQMYTEYVRRLLERG
ncbi:MAG: hypothetical protein IKR86_05995 [Candidatus Methanomethylophilaceae archaeon]|nr:hypothetical protein [Candidatus Methanomethylophilaceae archaeon]